MKIIFSSKRHYYLARVSIFLIMVALIAGMVGCAGESYALIIDSTEGGPVTVPGEGIFVYDEETVVNLTAEAEEGYRFTSWTGDVSTIADVEVATTNITMDDSYFITANFVVVYDLTISSTTEGSVTNPGEGTFTYDEGTVVNLVATPDSCYSFVDWTGNVGTIANVNAASTTITMMGDYSISANFEEIPPGQFGLTTSSTAGGSVTNPGEGTFPYDEGTVVDLVAEAEECYEFINWTGDTVADPGSATTNITMDGAKYVTANFALLSYNLTADSTDGGAVADPGEDTFTYDCGTLVPLVAAADEGYYLVNWSGDVDTIANINAPTTTITMMGDYSITANFAQYTPMVAASYFHTVGLKSDGTVVAVGRNDWGQCNVGGWTNIVQVAAAWCHTVGLKSDGTVVAVGWNDDGQCDVGGWTNIVQVAAGEGHTVGLKSDVTVVAVGRNQYGQCDVGGWTNIVQVAASEYHTVGLEADGTVVAVGDNRYGPCDVGDWAGIVQVAAGDWYTVGVKSDGTVVSVGDNPYGKSDVSGWTDIVQVDAGEFHQVGLKSDGTVVATRGWCWDGLCDVGGWAGIVQVAAGDNHTVGLEADGTVVAVGWNGYGQCDVGDWMLN